MSANSYKSRAWVIFDADNTLWDVERLYDDARDALCHFLARFGFKQDDVSSFQQRRDRDLFNTYGYSACRFPRSFEDTLVHFLPKAQADEIRHVRFLASRVFERKANPSKGTTDLLTGLADKYRLAIITSGERWVQEKRLRDFHLLNLFEEIEIVENKTARVFRSFCSRHKVDRQLSWVIGDSLKSDIIPAKEARLNAILISNSNWFLVETKGHSLPADVRVVFSLRDIAPILLDEAAPNTKSASV